MSARRAHALLLLGALGCHGSKSVSGDDTVPAPPAIVFSPNVPAWRGGCFFEGPAGKIVNGSPGPDVQSWGSACDGGSGGLVYLDHFDPIAGTGDVTVLASAAGSTPIVVAAAGGTGTIVPGSTGARIDAARQRLLTLRDVGFVTGDLVLVDLAHPASAPTVIATSSARVLNYDFLPSGAVLYVANYDATAREGDLFVWDGSAAAALVQHVSRAEFQLYRLDPARRRAAVLTGWSATGGGDLLLVDVSPSPGAPAVVDHAVERMEWTDAGALVWSVHQPDGTSALRVLPAAGTAAQPLDDGVRTWTVVGDEALYVKGWTVLAGYGTFARSPASAPGTPNVTGAQAAAEFGAARAAGGSAAAWVQVSDADRRSGTIWAAGPAAARAVEAGVVPRAGYWFSPAATFVAYARGFTDPFAAGSASPQPGIADEVRVAAVAAGAPFTAAALGSMESVAWDPAERWVAALAAFDPAANAGRLEVRDTSTGALVFSAERVPPAGFSFGDGSAIAAVRAWDDALRRGELVIQPLGSAGVSAVAQQVTSFLAPRRGRVVYAARGGGQDGLWVR